MQIGHESSNPLEPTVDQQLIDGVQLYGQRTENKDSRLVQLALMISGESKVMRDLKKTILRVNGFAQSDEHQEIILAKRLRCLTTSGVSVRHLSKCQELDLYLQELAQVGGDVTKAARRLGIKRTTLHMRIKRLERTLARSSTL